MVYQPPVGARDLFPLDVAQKRWIEEHIQTVFHRWGYHRIITSTLERLETLMAGDAIDPATVIQLQDLEGQPLGLRPELTASIARAAVTRMAGVPYPQRLYYNANVFRRAAQGSHNRQQEFYQAGVELLGAGTVAADAEILLLLTDALQALGLPGCHLILGEAGLTRSLLSAFPNSVRDQVREAIATLDRMRLETMKLSPELRERALLLLDLRGNPADVLQRISSFDLEPAQRETVNNLKLLLELLQASQAFSQSSHGKPLSIVLDLSLIQTFDYYTGIVFEVVSGTASGQRVLGQGGRYDQLLELYHPQGNPCPGIGFVLNIEELHQVLLSQEKLPLQTPACDYLVVAKTPDAMANAFAYAASLRESVGLTRVEVELGNRSTPEDVRDYARHRRIHQIAWVDQEGRSDLEQVDK
ncbi:ATP phosphoribosyltransferase regulatory subunit [Leptolyngbya ohadii]|uniref:ATP phosphoribosyltransferase regulatory subunit n=1 Tax=Leptolyngbya ohadii TaxID=1962290 RepID=UPI000B5A021A|nr:ATP phosphoribosyltransferase regulatory subunit [Leptolyngbya ohadii]